MLVKVLACNQSPGERNRSVTASWIASAEQRPCVTQHTHGGASIYRRGSSFVRVPMAFRSRCHSHSITYSYTPEGYLASDSFKWPAVSQEVLQLTKRIAHPRRRLRLYTTFHSLYMAFYMIHTSLAFCIYFLANALAPPMPYTQPQSTPPSSS